MRQFLSVDHKRADALVLSAPVDGLVYEWCPTMDLIAFTANNGKNVWVHRMNGYKVWSITIDEGMVKSLVWKPDGKQIAVMTTKNKCHIYDSNTARLLSTVDQVKDDICFAKWILSKVNEKNQKFCDLSDNEILKSLPKLPPLPNSTNNNTFSTKLAIEGMIQQTNRSNELDILLLISEKKLDVTLHGLFTAGPIELIPSANDDDEEIVNHISKDMRSHYIITSSFSTMKLYVRHFDISFGLDHKLLQDITLSSSKIIALSGYINEILIFLAQEIRTYLDLSKRFVEILKEELEKIDETVGDQLYDLLLTGMMSEELKDWLENTIGERGITRWTKVGDTAFDNTRRTIFYHLAPSCERLIVLLNNIKGAASASFSQDHEFNLEQINACISSVQKFMKLLFQCIIQVNKEQKLFNSFVTWINFVLRELQEEDSNYTYKTSEVSDFINSHLERSSMMMFIPNMRRHFNEIKINTSDLFDSLKELIKKSIIPCGRKIELGMVTEKQKLKFDGEILYIINYQNTMLTIYKLNTQDDQLKSVDIEMENEVTDVQISSVKNEIFVVSGDELLSFEYDHQIFKSTDVAKIPISQIELSRSKNFTDLNPKYLAINSLRNIGCLISHDMQRYMVFFLNDDENKASSREMEVDDTAIDS